MMARTAAGWMLLSLVLLFFRSAVAPTSSAQTAAPKPAANACNPRSGPRPYFLGDGRLDVIVPTEPLKVAEPNDVLLHAQSPGLACVYVEELQFLDEKTGDFSPLDGTGQSIPVLRRADGTPYFQFVPVRLGKVGVFVRGAFADGGFSKAKPVTLPVGPSSRKPAALTVGFGGGPGADVDRTRFSLDNPTDAYARQMRWFPTAWYWDLREAARPDMGQDVVLDMDYVHVEIRQPETNPVIAFDKATRQITPLRPGRALLEFSYGGLTRNVCVEVISRAVWLDFDNNCRELREAAPPSPLSATWSEDPDGLASPFPMLFSFYADRLSVTPPSGPVEFGQPVKIPLKISANGVRQIQFAQHTSARNSFFMAQNWPKGSGGLNHRLAAGVIDTPGSNVPAEIQIVPLALGEMTVGVAAEFDDHGFSQRFFRLHVIPSAKGLLGIELSSNKLRDGRMHLDVVAKYEQFTNPVPITNLQGVKISVDQPQDAPVIRVDEEGIVHELRPGAAVITANFAGATARLPITIALPLTPDPVSKPD
jgi:hypothetical protein